MQMPDALRVVGFDRSGVLLWTCSVGFRAEILKYSDE